MSGALGMYRHDCRTISNRKFIMKIPHERDYRSRKIKNCKQIKLANNTGIPNTYSPMIRNNYNINNKQRGISEMLHDFIGNGTCSKLLHYYVSGF